MIICTSPNQLQDALDHGRQRVDEIGFVPTMGALHQGHISLVNAALAKNLLTVASIFVNPTQFNNKSDFELYPRTENADITMLEQAGCHIVYLPQPTHIYPSVDPLPRHYELGNLENLLEGEHRPGHYQGVCQVVHRLLYAVRPHHLFMGIKDYQQCMVVQRLIDMHTIPVALHKVPTVREADGLAMSSRNRRLSAEQRGKAVSIYNALCMVKERFAFTPIRQLEEEAAAYLLDMGFASVDYVSIAHAYNLQPLQEGERSEPAVCLVAAWLGEIRLIDNLAL